MGRNWIRWHDGYNDPDNPLAARLQVVRRMIRASMEETPPGPIRVLSLCAGDGRDVAIAATGHPRAADLTGALVELDPVLASRASGNLRMIGSALEVRCADAGDPATFADIAPVDLLLLCGIFGNISDADIRSTIAALSWICSAGANVIWTRHRRAPDLTPSIQQWLADTGATTIECLSPDASSFAVGRARLSATRTQSDRPPRLFTFVDQTV